MSTISTEVDYYELLGVNYNSTGEEIKKAYRKKALKVHPDKNPDNPDAAHKFHELSVALDLLTDAQKKLEYDTKLKAKIANRKKHQALNARRRKFKEELEELENESKKQKQEEQEEKIRQQTELENLRTEDYRRRREREEKELLKKMEAEVQQASQPQQDILSANVSVDDCTLKVKWKKKVVQHDSDSLQRLFSKFGDVSNVISTKQGSALIVFKSIVSAHAAVTSQKTDPVLEPFKISWLYDTEPEIVKKLDEIKLAKPQGKAAIFSQATESASDEPPKPATTTPSFSFDINMGNNDYEAITLMRMRQAEKERLAKEIRLREALEDE
ncbi:DnaJ-domain-containing protein [Basidiobolus meristosporus CBS 931.73]|uniref:DnaJ-domain-containing protein n=1 Tax=Basidiobolus meristosporus CBS 931.73 TaxID=1314790 RepID=A0A1Y1YX54_9FUNG|nr:DnaJ-domain-containing protein [Basidiobolus meristosporus CBS 931.73]|eukprot:ORY02600.1 DnaJ-domain-containing protein [Basidiobolus meristosporus CBS 931.73]